jgi:hypothetical protein
VARELDRVCALEEDQGPLVTSRDHGDRFPTQFGHQRDHSRDQKLHQAVRIVEGAAVVNLRAKILHRPQATRPVPDHRENKRGTRIVPDESVEEPQVSRVDRFEDKKRSRSSPFLKIWDVTRAIEHDEREGLDRPDKGLDVTDCVGANEGDRCGASVVEPEKKRPFVDLETPAERGDDWQLIWAAMKLLFAVTEAANRRHVGTNS